MKRAKSEVGWVWGRRPVLAALRAGTANRILFVPTRQPASVLVEIKREARVRGVPSAEQSLADLERLTGSRNTQGVAAQVREQVERTLEDVLDDLRTQSSSAFLLVLDQIQDPHNLGALLRTAEAAGVHAVILPDRRSAPLSGTVAKTSAGAVSFIQIARVSNLDRALGKLRDAGIWIVGLDGEGDRILYEVDLTIPVALVVGSEGSGLRRLTREHCDFVARLPIQGVTESLNASVAGGIALYEAVRQRRAAAAVQ